MNRRQLLAAAAIAPLVTTFSAQAAGGNIVQGGGDIGENRPILHVVGVAELAEIFGIADGAMRRKGRVRLPDYVKGLLRCSNPSCISRPEHREGVLSTFRTLQRGPALLSCHYCDTLVTQEEAHSA